LFNHTSGLEDKLITREIYDSPDERLLPTNSSLQNVTGLRRNTLKNPLAPTKFL
jgi:hypothetical protein